MLLVVYSSFQRIFTIFVFGEDIGSLTKQILDNLYELYESIFQGIMRGKFLESVSIHTSKHRFLYPYTLTLINTNTHLNFASIGSIY